MPNIYIVTDSTSELPPEVCETYGIHIVPLKVHFGEETFQDGVDLTPDQFYNKLTGSTVLPTTSQPSPADFMETYKRIIAQDEQAQIISLHIAAELSGTCQSAKLAANLLDNDNITVVDSRSTCYGLGWMAITMAKAAAEGGSAAECIRRAEHVRERMGLYFIVDTLEYLQKGGRIGKAAAVAGSLLHIKPILSIDESGVIDSVDKVRGHKKAIARIVDLLKQRFSPEEEVIAFFPQAGQDTGAPGLRERILQEFNVIQDEYTSVGPVLGTHVGPGTYAVIMVPAKHE